MKTLLATEGTELKIRTTLKNECLSVCSVPSVANFFPTIKG